MDASIMRELTSDQQTDLPDFSAGDTAYSCALSRGTRAHSGFRRYVIQRKEVAYKDITVQDAQGVATERIFPHSPRIAEISARVAVGSVAHACFTCAAARAEPPVFERCARAELQLWNQQIPPLREKTGLYWPRG